MKSRIALPREDAMSAAQREVFDLIASGPRKGVRGPLRLLLHSPEMARRVQSLGEFLRWSTVLDNRLVELAILLTARHLKSDYVWKFHRSLVEDNDLFPRHVVDALLRHEEPDFGAADEKAVYHFARELLQHGRVGQGSLDEVVRLFGDRGVVELTTVIGYYHIGSLLVNVAELEVD